MNPSYRPPIDSAASPYARRVGARRVGKLLLLAMMVGGVAVGVPAVASSIEFIVDRADGEVFIKNPMASPVVLDAYSLFSPGEGLLVGGWTSITDLYDLSGDQSVDSQSDWFYLADPSATNVAEASLVEGSGSLNAGQIVSLGLFFNTNLLEGLIVTTSANGVTSDAFPADFRTLTADYDGDLDVDLDDHGVFAASYGSTGDLRADGNGDGVVNAADYTVWRDSSELVFTSGLSQAALVVAPAALSNAIPEPTSAVLAVMLIAGAGFSRRS